MSLSSACIHCGKCTKVCDFLKKYSLDLTGFEARKDLAYHCFLCGECDRVCPVGISGVKIAKSLRCEQTQGRELKAKGYGLVLLEKNPYRFKSWNKQPAQAVFFPGCNFTALYPKTLDKLIAICDLKGVAVCNDCCGKPIAELGLAEAASGILQQIAETMETMGADEIITACPNCYYYFKHTKGLGSIKITMIYDQLAQWDRQGIIKLNRELPQGDLFMPCPDKTAKGIIGQIKDLAPTWQMEVVGDVQCCGLGGMAGGKEPDLVRGFAERLQGRKPLYTYCATCTGQFIKQGIKDVYHILPHLLEVEETADVRHSLMNRIKRRF